MPKWNWDLLRRQNLMRVITEYQLGSAQFLIFLTGPLCCTYIWLALSWPLTKPHLRLFFCMRGSTMSGGSQWEPLGWGWAWRYLSQWCCDWKDTRVPTSPLGTYVHVYVPVGIQAQPPCWTWGQGAAAASSISGYEIWTTPNTLSLPGICLKSQQIRIIEWLELEETF